MRRAATIGMMIGIALLAWFVVDAQKPAVFAKVEITREAVVITNGNDVPWPSVTVLIDQGLDMPTRNYGRVAPGERVELPLRSFVRKLNGQAFNPAFERATDFAIEVPGFQTGIYRAGP